MNTVCFSPAIRSERDKPLITETMKMYQKPLIVVEQMEAMTVLMTSPTGDILGNPDQGLNGPSGKNAPARPF